MALIDLMAHAPTARGVEATLGTATSLWRAHDYEGVVRLLEPLGNDGQPIRADVTAEALQLLAQAYRLQGNNASAIIALEKAVRIRPRSTELKLMLASAYIDQSRHDAARDLLLRLAAPRDLPPTVMLRIARGMNQIGQIELAAQICNWALAKAPDDARLVFDRAIYLLRLGEPVYRIEALMIKASELAPSEPHYTAALASLMFRMGRPDEATRLLRTLAQEDLRRVRCKSCLRFLAASLFQIGETQLASGCTASLAHQKTQSRSVVAPVCFDWQGN